jgi:hypothetical protein
VVRGGHVVEDPLTVAFIGFKQPGGNSVLCRGEEPIFIVHVSEQKGLDRSKKDMKDKRDRPLTHSGEQSLQIIPLNERD